MHQSNYEEAEKMLQQVLAGLRRTYTDDYPETAVVMANLAMALGNQEKFGEAERMLRQSLEIKRRTLSEDHPSISNDIEILAETLLGKSQYTEAGSLLRQLRRKGTILGTRPP